MGRLSQSPFEVRFAATLFLLLLGIANFFGAWQVRRFAAFTPKGVAETVRPEMHHDMTMACCMESAAEEKPVDLGALNAPKHQVNRDLLVQDTHVHIPAYAMTAAFLSIIVFGLTLSRAARVAIIGLAFAAPFVDFAGLWGAHLDPAHGPLFGALAVAGGFAMGLAYTIVLALTLKQSWFSRTDKDISHA
jgi:hypothetical protein